MNKKESIKSFLLLFLFFLSFLFGMYSYHSRNIIYKVSRMVYHKLSSDETKDKISESSRLNIVTKKQAHKIDMADINSLPYLQGVVSAPPRTGVTIHKSEKAYAGLNLYVSSHKPSAYLLDMEGKVLHEWHCPFEKVWPSQKLNNPHASEKHKKYWSDVYLYPNGDVLAIFPRIGIIKLDKHSNLIWSQMNNAHHDAYVSENGKIYVLTEKFIKPNYNHEFNIRWSGKIYEDFISVLSPEGETIREISILKCFMNSNYAPVFYHGPKKGDCLHTNTVEVIEKPHSRSSSIFNKGLILISVREYNLLALIDPVKEKVTWTMSGMWIKQHHPTLVEDGNLMVFDNLGKKEKSRIIEIDPLTKKIEWIYEGNEQHPFYTKVGGICQRLPNGNTLITEYDKGRIFEVNELNEIVWEFINPEILEEENLTATVSMMVRVKASYADWLKEKR